MRFLDLLLIASTASASPWTELKIENDLYVQKHIHAAQPARVSSAHKGPAHSAVAAESTLSAKELLKSRAAPPADCPDYSVYSTQRHTPYSSGKYQLSSMRPVPRCRTFKSPAVEALIKDYEKNIADPDLYRLFLNSFPNSLDTAVKWKGFAADRPDEELTFLITGDINAMWLRDSANQMQSYLSLLKPSNATQSLASLFRGVINLQARYLHISPFCNSFQPPAESGVAPSTNSAASDDTVVPPYDDKKVFECKYELDSLAAFLEISYDYYTKTNDIAFFQKFDWVSAVNIVLDTAASQLVGTYATDGAVNSLNYTFTRDTTSSTETNANSGKGAPFKSTGLVRSFFRPSDDSTIFQGFIPANMMFARFLQADADIMAQIPGQQATARRMRQMASSIRTAIATYGVVQDPTYGKVYAFEVDGFGSRNMMDDANIPSLLAAPFFGYLDVNDAVYQSTRKFLLSADNPYFMRGPVINAIGGPHQGFGMAWPMASIVRILTTSDEEEMYAALRELVSSTDGLGLVHESINSFNQSMWTRQWFSWANGLFGQMIIDVYGRAPGVLKRSYQ